MYRVLIVGLGKVGSSLLNVLASLKNFDITVLDTQKDFEEAWAEFLPAHAFFKDFNNLPDNAFDYIAICTPDDQITSVIRPLQRLNLERCKVFHTSGSKSADLLRPLKKKGAQIGSLHPLQTFNRLFLPAEVWQGIVCTFQGDLPLFDDLRNWLESFQVEVVKISSSQKQLLHLAATISANFQVALYSWAQQLLHDGGLKDYDLNRWLGPLIRQVSENLSKEPLARILSGPLQRGDLKTLQQHFSILQNRANSNDTELYRLLCLKLLENPQFEIKNRQKLKAFLEQYEA